MHTYKTWIQSNCSDGTMYLAFWHQLYILVRISLVRASDRAWPHGYFKYDREGSLKWLLEHACTPTACKRLHWSGPATLALFWTRTVLVLCWILHCTHTAVLNITVKKIYMLGTSHRCIFIILIYSWIVLKGTSFHVVHNSSVLSSKQLPEIIVKIKTTFILSLGSFTT